MARAGRNPRKPAAHPALIVDAMLGRLARWLRILGFDTLYLPRAGDDELARRAAAERRLLITRDRELAARRRPGLKTVLVTAREHRAQLREVVDRLGARPPGIFSRCLVCNAPLERIAPEDAAAGVPDFVLATRTDFHRCPACRRIYWRGSHRDEIEKVLAELDIASA